MNFLDLIKNIIAEFLPLVIFIIIFLKFRKYKKSATFSVFLKSLSKLDSNKSREIETIINSFKTNTPKNLDEILKNNLSKKVLLSETVSTDENTELIEIDETISETFPVSPNSLNRKNKYLHIALNSTLEEAYDILSKIPRSDRILIEVGTPLIKIYGTDAIRRIKSFLPIGTYIIADNKCADLAEREVQMMAEAGANAATCLGIAPIETINEFIAQCEKYGIDSMIDMMNVDNALSIIKRLDKLPKVVMLHRGVDETQFSKEKQIPYYQIKQIKGNYNIMVAVAGGDTIKEVQRAIFNDADIVVVWKNFYSATEDTASLADSFLKEI